MLIDISYPYTSSMSIYPNNPLFEIKQIQKIERGDGANVSSVSLGTHTGTHIDAPSHFILGGKTIDEIPLELMNGCAKLIDLSKNEEITKELLAGWDINKGDIVILKTDNSNIFHCDVVLEDYVTLNYEAAEYLAEKKVKMVCIDYMTIERPKAKRVLGKSIHGILLSNNVLIGESLNLTEAREGEYQLYCFPINILGADGAPVRMVLSKKAEDSK